MIDSKSSLQACLEKDRYALKIQKKHPSIWGDEIWRYQIYLRKHEYYLNTRSNPLLLAYYKARHHYLGVKLGFSIPCNVFDAGLRINHYGYIVVSPKAKVGEFCDIHQGVNIGESTDGKAPIIGSDVWIGPGAKLFGDIMIGNDMMIGANAVVNHSFIKDGEVLAGVPARVISQEGNVYKRR